MCSVWLLIYTQITHLVLWPLLKQSYPRVSDRRLILSIGYSFLLRDLWVTSSFICVMMPWTCWNGSTHLKPFMLGLFWASLKEIIQYWLTLFLEFVTVESSSHNHSQRKNSVLQPSRCIQTTLKDRAPCSVVGYQHKTNSGIFDDLKKYIIMSCWAFVVVVVMVNETLLSRTWCL